MIGNYNNDDDDDDAAAAAAAAIFLFLVAILHVYGIRSCSKLQISLEGARNQKIFKSYERCE